MLAPLGKYAVYIFTFENGGKFCGLASMLGLENMLSHASTIIIIIIIMIIIIMMIIIMIIIIIIIMIIIIIIIIIKTIVIMIILSFDIAPFPYKHAQRCITFHFQRIDVPCSTWF